MDLSFSADSIAPRQGRSDALAAERALVERARHDRTAFAQLYRRHYPDVARYLHARTADRHATEDLLAETFLAVMKGLAGYRFRGVPFKWWVLRIANNVANRWARKVRSSCDVLAGDWDEPAGEGAASTRIEEREERERVHALVRSLPPRQQSVVVLHYLEDLSIAEISAALGCGTGTVKSQLHRARAALRALLENREP